MEGFVLWSCTTENKKSKHCGDARSVVTGLAAPTSQQKSQKKEQQQQQKRTIAKRMG